MVSVAFVDDHPFLLEGLQSIFSRRAGFEVVGIGSTCSDAHQIAHDMQPEVIVLDLNMDGDVFVSIHEIRAASPNIKIIAFTASANVNHAVKALEAGASGYVLKGGPLGSLAEAIETVVLGGTYITQGFATKLVTAMKQAKSGDEPKLSSREAQIMRLVLEGRTNKEIGRQLDLTEKTVKYYMTILMQKLNVKNRVGVAVVAQSLASAEMSATPNSYGQ
ncbi:MAG: response regulator transcription factor [Rhizobium sp.]|nr:response regulator transcription factor [Rhizobium sp.]